MDPGLKFKQNIEIQPVRSPAYPPNDVVAPLPQAVVGEFAGVFFQGGEVEIGNPGFAYEADQQVLYARSGIVWSQDDGHPQAEGLCAVAGGRKAARCRLVQAVQEMESGLIDADLGGFLYKKRVARPGGGKSGGYRTLLSARIGSRYVFLHGFPKSDKANITQDEKKALQFAGKVFLELSADALSKALQSGVLLEVHCEQDH
jgi:hypothetical protein